MVGVEHEGDLQDEILFADIGRGFAIHQARITGISVVIFSVVMTLAFWVTALVAFLRSQVSGDEQLPDSKIGPVTRALLFYYKQIYGTILSAEMIDHDAPRMDSAKHELPVHGHYLAQTVCTECHGEDLRGALDGSAPDLVVALAYSLEDFRKLMRSGEPTGDRQLELMAVVAQGRFAHFTDREIDALHAYLQTLATTPVGRR